MIYLVNKNNIDIHSHHAPSNVSCTPREQKLRTMYDQSLATTTAA